MTELRKRGRGRPRTLWPAAKEELVMGMVADGKGLQTIAMELGIGLRSIATRIAEDEDFAARYRRAKMAYVEVMSDEIITLADSATKEDWGAKRLMVDTRKWLLCKLIPRIYGDRVQTEISGEIGLKRVISDI